MVAKNKLQKKYNIPLKLIVFAFFLNRFVLNEKL